MGVEQRILVKLNNTINHVIVNDLKNEFNNVREFYTDKELKTKLLCLEEKVDRVLSKFDDTKTVV